MSAYEDDRGAGSADRLGAQAKQRLRLAVDQVKIDLSGADSVTLSVDMGAASLLLLTQDSDLNTVRTIMVLPLHVAAPCSSEDCLRFVRNASNR